MLKFWRSPKLAQKEHSPSPPPPAPPPPATRPDAPTASALHGLGLGLPEDFENDLRHVPAHPRSRADDRRASGTARGASSLSVQPHTKAPLEDHAPRGNGSRVLRERNGNDMRNVSPSPAGSDTLGPASSNPARALSPASYLTPSVQLSVGNREGLRSVASVDFADRDPTQIYAPTTWSEMAHHELVVNLSPRERTRQEILWEVVASEERYVAELRSLVNHYADPLLHPLASSVSLSPSPRVALSPEPGKRPTTSCSTSSLPIASRFARTPEPECLPVFDGIPAHTSAPDVVRATACSIAPVHTTRRAASGGLAAPCPPSGSHLSAPSVRRQASSTTTLTTSPSTTPSTSSSTNLSTRIASAFRSRPHPPDTGRSKTAGHGNTRVLRMAGSAPLEAPLPAELRDALEACVEMLRGHEELSTRLKEQWAKAFPLVRGLAAIWSSQPWFLETYTTYVLSLEAALSALDRLLPSTHTHTAASSSKSQLRPSERRLADTLSNLEEQAADAGESGLGICLSKPLMRLGKLPLLMQALLYHTDPTTHEWEKTRAMALEVDALVRSIEDEKVEEEERERTRDALARIDGVNDKALMAPRAARILISETPVPASSTTSTAGASSGVSRGKFSRSISAVASGVRKNGGNGKGAEWLICFTDVIVRAVKTGETSIPGNFSREKEKRGKQGAARVTGKTRNTYRFVRIERWEPREVATQKLEEMNERRRNGAVPTSEDEGDEDDEFDAESCMSFRYDADLPQPVLSPPRSFLAPSHPSRSLRAPSPATVPFSAPASAKFGTRLRAETPVPYSLSSSAATAPAHKPLRATTPVPPCRINAPTVSSQAKSQHTPGTSPLPYSPPSLPPSRAYGPTAANGSRESSHPSAETERNGGLAHARDESSFGLYAIWAGAQDN